MTQLKVFSRNRKWFVIFSDVIQRSVLIEGVLFRARYLGSTQLVCEGQPTKTTRMMQAEEAVSRIKVKHVNVSWIYCITIIRNHIALTGYRTSIEEITANIIICTFLTYLLNINYYIIVTYCDSFKIHFWNCAPIVDFLMDVIESFFFICP